MPARSETLADAPSISAFGDGDDAVSVGASSLRSFVAATSTPRPPRFALLGATPPVPPPSQGQSLGTPRQSFGDGAPSVSSLGDEHEWESVGLPESGSTRRGVPTGGRGGGAGERGARPGKGGDAGGSPLEFESVEDASAEQWDGAGEVGLATPEAPQRGPAGDVLSRLLGTPSAGFVLPRPGTVLMRVPESEEAADDEQGRRGAAGEQSGAAASAGTAGGAGMVVLAGDTRSGGPSDLGRLFEAASGVPRRIEPARPGRGGGGAGPSGGGGGRGPGAAGRAAAGGGALQPLGPQLSGSGGSGGSGPASDSSAAAAQRLPRRGEPTQLLPRREKGGSYSSASGESAGVRSGGSSGAAEAPAPGGESFSFAPPAAAAAGSHSLQAWRSAPGGTQGDYYYNGDAGAGALEGGGGFASRGGELLMQPGAMLSRLSEPLEGDHAAVAAALRARGSGPAAAYGLQRRGAADSSPSWRVSFPHPTPAASGSGERGEAESTQQPRPLAGSRAAVSLAAGALSLEAVRSQPLPVAYGCMQCFVTVDNSRSRSFPVYKMFLQGRDGAPDRFLLSAQLEAGVPLLQKKRYVLSSDPECCRRGTAAYCGQLRSNTLGSKFTLFDSGEKRAGGRCVLGAVVFEPTAGSTSGGYRKMSALFPNQLSADIKSWEEIRDGRDVHLLTSKVPNYKLVNGAYHYCYKFGGRVKLPSVKNCQLVLDGDQDLVVLQFGKITGTLFACDFTAPLSAMQAFALALASIDNKLAFIL